jgi:hypothetical protein
MRSLAALGIIILSKKKNRCHAQWGPHLHRAYLLFSSSEDA